jgi:hypothetical protein
LANPLNNLNEALAELEKKTIRTSQGEFVRMEDVRKLVQEQKDATAVEEGVEKEKPRDMVKAKQAILKDPEIMKNFPAPRREPGKAIPASEPRSSSRT